MNYKDNIKNIQEKNILNNNLNDDEKKVIIKNLSNETTEENLNKFIKEKCGLKLKI